MGQSEGSCFFISLCQPEGLPPRKTQSKPGRAKYAHKRTKHKQIKQAYKHTSERRNEGTNKRTTERPTNQPTNQPANQPTKQTHTHTHSSSSSTQTREGASPSPARHARTADPGHCEIQLDAASGLFSHTPTLHTTDPSSPLPQPQLLPRLEATHTHSLSLSLSHGQPSECTHTDTCTNKKKHARRHTRAHTHTHTHTPARARARTDNLNTYWPWIRVLYRILWGPAIASEASAGTLVTLVLKPCRRQCAVGLSFILVTQ